MSEEISDRDFMKDESSNKREISSNDASKINRYKHKLKEILNDGRKLRNKTEFDLADKIYSLLQMYHIKHEAWFGGAKQNGVNYRRLMDKNEEIINNIRDIFITINKGTVLDEDINIHCDKHKQILTEMDNAYRCM